MQALPIQVTTCVSRVASWAKCTNTAGTMPEHEVTPAQTASTIQVPASTRR